MVKGQTPVGGDWFGNDLDSSIFLYENIKRTSNGAVQEAERQGGMQVKVIPITQGYRDGYEAIRWDEKPVVYLAGSRVGKTVMDETEIIYGSDTETGRRTFRVK